MKYGTIRYEQKESIAYIYLNRSAAMNAINEQMQTELVDAFGRVKEDDAVKAMILTSDAESGFSVGLDSRELMAALQEAAEKGDAALGVRSRFAFVDPWAVLSSQPKPMVAALHGLTLGAGLELSLACDIRIAAEDAKFGFPDVRMGLIPMHGGTQRLPRIIGRGKALEMILSGEQIDAEEAYRLQLVTKVVPKKDMLPVAEDVARQLAEKAPIAIRYAREAIVTGQDLTYDQGLHLEMDLYALLQTTSDRMEGLNSFREKRSPMFKGE